MAFQELGRFDPGQSMGGLTVGFDRVRPGVFPGGELVLGGGFHTVIRSALFDPTNEAGWAIFGDGSASFYGDLTIGADAVIHGDLVSDNWDGAEPVDLSAGEDVGATVGFALDSSAGAAQFMGDLYVTSGEISGSTITGGDITGSTITGALFQTDTSGSRIVIDGSTADSYIRMYDGATQIATMGFIDPVMSEVGIRSTSTNMDLVLEADNGKVFIAGGNGGVTVQGVSFFDGNLRLPNSRDIYMGSSGQIYHGTGVGTPRIDFTSSYIGINNGPWNLLTYSNRTEVRTNLDAEVFRFYGDTDTYLTRPASNHIDMVCGGSVKLRAGTGTPAVSIHAPYSSGQSVLYLDIERGWNFLQRGTGASTDLELRSTSNKGFFIGDQSNGVIADFHYGSIKFPGRGTTTNSGLAAWRNNGFPGDQLLALSSSKEDKKDIKDAPAQKYLKRIDQLRPREYKSKASADDGRRVFLGLVKEEAEKVWPHWTYEAMTVPLLIAAQDLRRRVAELEKQVAALTK